MRVKRGALLANDDLGGDVVERLHQVGERVPLGIDHSHWHSILERSHRWRGVGGECLCDILAISEDNPLGFTGRFDPLRAFLA